MVVQGHPLLIREALQNLIDNAVRYAGAGSEVTVGVWRDGAFGVVQVADTGPGIPSDMHRAVFERFVRATHEGSGCGLGLAIVKSIAERHGGQVALTGMSPHGLQVRIALPLAR